MIITIDTEKLSQKDVTLLHYLLGSNPSYTFSTPMTVQVGGSGGGGADITAATTPKTRKSTPKAEQNDEGTSLAEKPTMADAVRVVTEFVAAGKTAVVKAALATVGAKRVSELTDETLGEFLSTLETEA